MVERVNGMPAACAARHARNLAIASLHAAKPDGGKRQRKPRRLAEDGGLKVALRDVNEHALAQLDALKVRSIGA